MKWEKKNIDDVCDVGDGAHASIKRVSLGVQYLTSKNFKLDGLDLGKVDFISEEDYQKHFKDQSKAITKPQNDDVLLSIIGSLGAPYKVKENDIFGLSSSVSILRPKKNIIEAAYLYYWIKSNEFQNSVQNIKSGVAQSFLSLGMIKSLPVNFPNNLPIQRKIASILSAYDDLIENNLKRIKLLEEQAFLKYKGIVNSEKLEEFSILDICYVTDGTHDSPKQQSNGIFLVTGKHLIDGFVDFSSAYRISEADHDKIQKRSKIVNGDLILSNIGTIGNVAIIDSPFDFSVKNVIIFKPNDLKLTTFLYCYLKSNEMQTRFQQESTGTSQKFISLTYARALKVKLPNKEILKIFNQEVAILLKLKSILNLQNLKLREARDILLPRLMNGQIEV
jgi:type I restriction enzyme S subunit